MEVEELKIRLQQAIENLRKKAQECSNCRIGQGQKYGLEHAAYEIECAMDKRKRKDMAK